MCKFGVILKNIRKLDFVGHVSASCAHTHRNPSLSSPFHVCVSVSYVEETCRKKEREKEKYVGEEGRGDLLYFLLGGSHSSSSDNQFV